MNTKVKVGIAAAIVAALIALIVLDQKSASTSGAPSTAGASSTGGDIVAPVSGGGADLQGSREEEVQIILERVRQNLGTGNSNRSSAEPPAAPVQAPVLPAPPAPTSPRSDEYVIQSGDTLETIAQAKYGSRTYQTLILEANPGLNPLALRIGKTIALPAKAETAVKEPEETASKDLAAAPLITPPAPDATGAKTYVIQPGDTLSGISVKVYKTSRHYDKILEANRDKISDPHLLVVGAKLTMPDLPVRNASATPTAQVPISAPAASGKTHTVQSGDSLWRVAEAYAAGKGLGILDMMKEIIKANPDKLKDEKTLLRLGWQLVVPD